MPDSVLAYCDRDEINTIRWLKKAASTDESRPELGLIHVKDGLTFAANGYCVHGARTPVSLDGQTSIELQGFTRGKWPFVIFRPIETTTEARDTVEKFIRDTERRKPVFRYSVNPHFLRDALDGMAVRGTYGPAHLSFYGSTEPVKVEQGDKLALVMPMHSESVGDLEQLLENLLKVARLVAHGDGANNEAVTAAAVALKMAGEPA